MKNNHCETCDNSGYVWRKGPDGKEWMYDCDNDDCNAFGQLDDWTTADAGDCDDCGDSK